MKFLTLLTAILALGLSIATGDAEAAKRFGGGSSMGMQRQMTPPPKAPTAAPAPSTPAPVQAAPAAQPKRSWMGPLAGLAAGIGLAALASHFGFGEELASIMMIGLAVMVVMMVIGFIMRRRAGPQPALAGGNGTPYANSQAFDVQQPAAGGSAGASGNIPAGFDVDGFVRNAKVNFIRLQAANDAGNLEDIREFTTPEMFAEIKMNLNDRAGAGQQTDVVTVNAEVLDVTEDPSRYVVSVRFNGLIREEASAAAAPFDEIWHMVKPKDGSRGWVVAGIQQVQ